MSIEVESTTAGRKLQSVAQTPAAVHVLTADDLRRSGATTLPEALRLVPGLQVAHLKAYSWAISARGFNGEYANKMLVMLDGRSVYTPLFSGTYWDSLDLPLDIIERVEVILGPGASLWGANAVNGVINIVTKPAAHSEGVQVSALGGNMDQAIGYARYGGKLGESGAFRAWTRYGQRDEYLLSDGSDADDAWNNVQGGARADWMLGQRDSLTLQSAFTSITEDLTSAAFQPTPPFTNTISDARTQKVGFVRGRWERDLGQDSSLALQSYFDVAEYRVPGYWGEDRINFDLDLQHRIPLGTRHDVMWGLGYRVTDSTITAQSFSISVQDDHRTYELFSAFIQDEITLIPERWRLLLGTKVEHNDFTGYEVQPKVRTLWNITPTQVGWASIARAVRSPNQIETDGIIPSAVVPGAPPTFFTFFGNDQMISEVLVAYEVGYRNQFCDKVAIDVAAFFNDYDELRTLEPGTPFLQSGAVMVPLLTSNLGEAVSWGGEVAIDWFVTDTTRVRPSYSLIEVDWDQDPSSLDSNTGNGIEGSAPRHSASLWVNHDLAEDWDLDAALFYVDDLSAGSVPEYWKLDMRAEWRPSADLRFVTGVQGLFHDDEPEFYSSLLSEPHNVRTAWYLGVTWSR